jgi:hypothetical protein
MGVCVSYAFSPVYDFPDCVEWRGTHAGRRWFRARIVAVSSLRLYGACRSLAPVNRVRREFPRDPHGWGRQAECSTGWMGAFTRSPDRGAAIHHATAM